MDGKIFGLGIDIDNGIRSIMYRYIYVYTAFNLMKFEHFAFMTTNSSPLNELSKKMLIKIIFYFSEFEISLLDNMHSS